MKTLWTVKFAVSICAFLSFQGVSVAASFDCSKAKTNHEKFICSNPEVNQADFQLGVAYRQAINKFRYPDLIRRSQTEWLRSYRNCSVEKNCLQMIKERINTLDIYQKSTLYTNSKEQKITEWDATIIIYDHDGVKNARFFGRWLPKIGDDPSKIRGYPHDGIWCDEEMQLVRKNTHYAPREWNYISGDEISLVFKDSMLIMRGDIPCDWKSTFPGGVYQKR